MKKVKINMTPTKIEIELSSFIINKINALKILNENYKDLDFHNFILNYLDTFISEEIIKSISVKNKYINKVNEDKLIKKEIESNENHFIEDVNNYSYAESLEDDVELVAEECAIPNEDSLEFVIPQPYKINYDNLINSKSKYRYHDHKLNVKVSNSAGEI